MSAKFRAIALLLSLSATESRAAADSPSGFDFCAPPLRPACIEAPASVAACEAEVQGFIASVRKYRECLEKETSRAIRDANDALDVWKCRSGRVKCQ